MEPEEITGVVNQCPMCGNAIDVTELPPFSKVNCPHCGEAVRLRVQVGKYHIERLLGVGGMSQVFLADDTTLNRQVALKVLHHALSKDAGLMAMFEREAQAMGFSHAACGPMVRSSYHADQQAHLAGVS